MPTRLPNLLIVGVTKAGTTSLFSYLAQHREICGSTLKETGYFSRLVYPDAVLSPIGEYERYFGHCRGERYVMEASPNYWYGGPRLLDALEATLHSPRYIMLLRDPVERFWSDFSYMRSKLLLPADLSAEDFLVRCEEARARNEEFTEPFRLFRTLSTGFYGEHLPLWWDRVGDRLRTVFFDELVDQPDTLMHDLLGWLDLDPAGTDALDYTGQNETVGHRSPILQGVAYRTSRRLDRLMKRHPRVKERVVATYYRLNGTGARTDVLDPKLRLRLKTLYEPANRMLGQELRARGYERLPPWLAEPG